MNKCIDCQGECKTHAKRCIKCSNAMNRLRTQEKNRKAFEDKSCVICGTTFVPYASDQKTCTYGCKQKHKNELSNLKWANRGPRLPNIKRKK